MSKRLLLVILLTLFIMPPAWSASPKAWLTLDGASGATADTYSWNGGSGTLQVWGAFTGGPSVSLEWTSFGSAPFLEVDSSECTLTAANTFCNFSIGNGDLRLIITGGSGVAIVSARIGQPNQASAGGGGGFALAAACIDADDDGNCEVEKELAADAVLFDVNDDGVVDMRFVRFTGTTFDIQSTSIMRFDPLGTAVGGAYASGFQTGPSIGTEIAGAWRNVTTTSTVPTGVMTFSDLTSGIGRDTTTGGIALIDDSILGVLVESTQITISDGLTLGLPGSNSPPATCNAAKDGHIYWDLNQLIVCRCDSTIWEGMLVSGGGAITCT